MICRATHGRDPSNDVAYTLVMPQMRVVVLVQAAPGPSIFKIRGQDKGKHFTENINLTKERKNRPLEAGTHAYLLQ